MTIVWSDDKAAASIINDEEEKVLIVLYNDKGDVRVYEVRVNVIKGNEPPYFLDPIDKMFTEVKIYEEKTILLPEAADPDHDELTIDVFLTP